jgi:hypothetical protein
VARVCCLIRRLRRRCMFLGRRNAGRAESEHATQSEREKGSHKYTVSFAFHLDRPAEHTLGYS